MSHLTSKLKALKLELSDNLLVHLVLISIPAQFSHFKVNYNCQKWKWVLNEFILYYVQEEEMLEQEIAKSIYLANPFNDNFKKRKNKDDVFGLAQKEQQKPEKI